MKDFAVPLVIAVIGLAATGLGAVVGARATKFGAEKSAEAARRQVQDQGAIEHGHWLRQQRFSTYESLLEAWDECLRLTQASAADDGPDSTGLEDLRLAADRMAGRARRIAILGPPEVTHAAESLAETMQEDVKVAVRFIEVAQAAITAVDGLPVPIEAMSEATDEYQHGNQQLAELVSDHRSQGRDLRELDGHPLLRAAMESMEQYRQTSGKAREALNANVERISAAASEAFSMADVLTRNREARELSREQFTSAAREALSKTPTPELRADPW
ncbi:hypothetical protein PH213_01425 [Streptomyces sp. SRF1]|uniref:hypothetical protein n=1 Tax=Streptomyces sp. SRF1 TaxID=1549642 RepID=UPI0025B1209A|nr:hypothetical protein [Streptomyces sp. SRF1]MDN3053230.1 hypothetical protein [Streptomyces sp. SRF1]